MAASLQNHNPRDPLNVLQKMFSEVLVQTGKAIRGSTKDGSKVVGANALRNKMPDTMTEFHYALDDLESEITRAKAVLLRDLEQLRAARMPVAPPAPMTTERKQPTAVMMEMPSTAAHTVATNSNFHPQEESKRVAPFPDMGMSMGISADIVDLSASDKPSTGSPRIASCALKSSTRTTPQMKPSPKPTPSAKVTPVPLPQTPQFSQPTGAPSGGQRGPVPQPTGPAAQPSGDSSLDAMGNLPTSGETGGGAAVADMSGGELSFTNMQFSLAPSSDGPSQNAPPAPMQDIDLSSFTNIDNDGGNDMTLDNLGSVVGDAAPQARAQNNSTNQAGNAAGSNSDDMFNLDNTIGVDSMELDLNLGDGSGGMGGAFNDSFYEEADSNDMSQFDDSFFNMP